MEQNLNKKVILQTERKESVSIFRVGILILIILGLLINGIFNNSDKKNQNSGEKTYKSVKSPDINETKELNKEINNMDLNIKELNNKKVHCDIILSIEENQKIKEYAKEIFELILNDIENNSSFDQESKNLNPFEKIKDIIAKIQELKNISKEDVSIYISNIKPKDNMPAFNLSQLSIVISPVSNYVVFANELGKSYDFVSYSCNKKRHNLNENKGKKQDYQTFKNQIIESLEDCINLC